MNKITIDPENPLEIAGYGAVLQRSISDFSVHLLEKVGSLDLGEVQDALRELSRLSDPGKKERRGLFGKPEKEDVIRKEDLSRIENTLRRYRITLARDLSLFRQMSEQNRENLRELTETITAGRLALESARTEILPGLRKQAEATGSPEDLRALRCMEAQCLRLEKRLLDLEITRTVSLQTAAQCRLLENSDRELLEKLRFSLQNTLPLINSLQEALAVSERGARERAGILGELKRTENHSELPSAFRKGDVSNTGIKKTEDR